MRFTTQVKSISYLKANAADIWTSWPSSVNRC